MPSIPEEGVSGPGEEAGWRMAVVAEVGLYGTLVDHVSNDVLSSDVWMGRGKQSFEEVEK